MSRSVLVSAVLMVLVIPAGCSRSAPPSTPSVKGPKQVAARVLGREVTCGELGLTWDNQTQCDMSGSCSADAPVNRLSDIVTTLVTEDFIRREDLAATQAEIKEMAKEMADFMEQSSKEREARRKKNLAEIEEKLKARDLSDPERKRLEERRDMLRKLEQFEAATGGENAQMPEDQLREIYAPWIEIWKVNKAIYGKYGGVVAVTKFGPDPVGARKRLLEEYAKEGKLTILDEGLRAQFWRLWSQPPRWVMKPEEVEFTPWWKKAPAPAKD